MNDLAQGGLTRYMADSIPYMRDPLVKPDSILFRFCYHVDMQAVRELAPCVKLYCTADDPAELAKAPPELWQYAVRSGPDLYQQCFDAVDIVNLVALAPVCKIPDITRTNPTASGNPTQFVFQCHGCCSWTDQCIRYNRGRSDHYHAVSNAVARHLNKNHGISLDDITVIEAGVNRTRILPTLDYDDARIRFLREANQFIETDMHIQYAIMQAPWLLFYGRLSPEKGLHTLTAGVKQMIDLAREFKLPWEPDIQQWLSRAILLVVGDGWDAVNQLRILRDTLPTRNVYLPWTDSVGNVLEASDLFVCMSDAEGGPMTAIEALMNGVSVLSTPVGLTTDLRYTTRTGLNRSMVRILTGQSPIAEQIAAALVESRTAEWEQEKLQISWLVTRRFNPYLKARQWTDYFKGLVPGYCT